MSRRRLAAAWVLDRILRRQPAPLLPLEAPRPRFRWLEGVRRALPAWLRPRKP